MCSDAEQVGKDGTRSGWLSDNGAELGGAAGGAEIDWRVADCHPGEVVILGEHGSKSSGHEPSKCACTCLICSISRTGPLSSLTVVRDVLDIGMVIPSCKCLPILHRG